jgi:hypothetical protein
MIFPDANHAGIREYRLTHQATAVLPHGKYFPQSYEQLITEVMYAYAN